MLCLNFSFRLQSILKNLILVDQPNTPLPYFNDLFHYRLNKISDDMLKMPEIRHLGT